jgi:GAF domain-containing protein
MTQFYDDGFDPNDLSIKVSDMLVATADASDELIDSAVSEMLLLLRERLKMDVVFVSEFVGDQQTFRYVDAPPDLPLLTVGESNPLEESWCQRVVDGRLPQVIPDVTKFANQAALPAAPFDIGTYLSTPIFLGGGQVYGTLCCLSFSPHESVQERDLKNLKSVAMLVAKKIDKSQAEGGQTQGGEAKAPMTFSRQPKV